MTDPMLTLPGDLRETVWVGCASNFDELVTMAQFYLENEEECMAISEAACDAHPAERTQGKSLNERIICPYESLPEWASGRVNGVEMRDVFIQVKC